MPVSRINRLVGSPAAPANSPSGRDPEDAGADSKGWGALRIRALADRFFSGTNRMASALSWQPAAHFPLPVLGRCLGRSRHSRLRPCACGLLRAELSLAGKVQPIIKTGTVKMFSHSSAALSSNLRDLDRRLRSLESHLQRIGNRTSVNAALAADGIGEAVASALSSLADGFAATRPMSATKQQGPALMPCDACPPRSRTGL